MLEVIIAIELVAIAYAMTSLLDVNKTTTIVI